MYIDQTKYLYIFVKIDENCKEIWENEKYLKTKVKAHYGKINTNLPNNNENENFSDDSDDKNSDEQNSNEEN